MQVEVILDPSWNNLSPYKGISVTLGDGGEQLGLSEYQNNSLFFEKEICVVYCNSF